MMAFRWRADDDPGIECWLGSFAIFQGIRTCIARKSYIFVIFQGGLDPLFHPLDLRMQCVHKLNALNPAFHKKCLSWVL